MKRAHLKEFRAVKRNPRVSAHPLKKSLRSTVRAWQYKHDTSTRLPSKGVPRHPVWLEMEDMIVQREQEGTLCPGTVPSIGCTYKQGIQHRVIVVRSERQEKRRESEYTSSSGSNQGRECRFYHKVSQPWRNDSLQHPESAQGGYRTGPSKEVDSRKSKLWPSFWTIKSLNRKLESLNLKPEGILKVKQESLHSIYMFIKYWLNKGSFSLKYFQW